MPIGVTHFTEPTTRAERAAMKEEQAQWRALDRRICDLEAALARAIAYCDCATHPDNQYSDERSELLCALFNK